jgi:hypothetical protein
MSMNMSKLSRRYRTGEEKRIREEKGGKEKR